MQTIIRNTIILAGLLLPVTALANEGLLVTPHRVVLEGRERESKITVTNTGNEEVDFKFSFVHFRMTEEGQFEPATTATEAGSPFAEPLLRFSPKRTRVPPGKTQVVRMRTRFPAQLSSGEYRSHFVVQALPKATAQSLAASPDTRAKASITAIYGISIPVIVRVGELPTQVSIYDAQIEDQQIEIMLNRTGEASVYGNFSVYLRTEGADPLLVGESNGVAVYPPLERRKVKFPVKLPPDASGSLSIVFSDGMKKGTILAEKEITLQ